MKYISIEPSFFLHLKPSKIIDNLNMQMMKNMKNSIGQMIALTCYGNAFLQGKDIKKIFPDNSTCVFDELVNFVEWIPKNDGGWDEKPIAPTPDDWFILLKKENAVGIQLSRTSQDKPGDLDRNTAGFVGGGGLWELLVTYKNGSNSVWNLQKKIGNKDHPFSKIWRNSYGTQKNVESPDIFDGKSDITRDKLLKCLEEIYKLSSKHKEIEFYTNIFKCALSVLKENTIIQECKKAHYFDDLYPEGGLDELNHFILLASQISDVFGGMGTWNDIWVDGLDYDEYSRTSENLFLAMNEGFIVAANSTFIDKRLKES